MDLLTLGMILFFGVHLLPFAPGLRNRLFGLAGENVYKGIFSLAALGGLVAMGFGFARAEYVEVWAPASWSFPVALHAMPVVFILLAAANTKTHIRKIIRHPMALGVFLWSVMHLAANGDVASLKLFGSFAVFAIFSVIATEARGKRPDYTPAAKFDVIAVVSGLVLYGVVLYFHGALFGAPVI